MRTTCDDRALASTISGTSSSIVRAPSKRMFISNSSYYVVRPSYIPLGNTTTYPEDLDSLLHTILAIAAERIEERPANTDCLRTKGKRLEDVARAAHTAVDEDLEVGVGEVAARAQCGDDLDEDFEAGARRIELPAAVVREDDSLHTGFVRQDRVLRRRDTLQDNRHCQANVNCHAEHPSGEDTYSS